MSRVNTPNLDNWNPMQEDYEDRTFNSYAGRNLYQNLSGFGMPQQQPRTVNYSHEVFALHVRRIPINMSEVGLRNLFSKHGHVLDVKVICPNGMQNPSYLFGKVYFGTPHEAMKGLQELNDKPPLHLKVELDRHYFGSEGRQVEAPRFPIHNSAGNGRTSQNERFSGGRGLLPTPLLSVQVQPEFVSRTVNTHQNLPVHTMASVSQGHAGSLSKPQIEMKDNRCVKCQLKGTKCCTRCKTVYCSEACQKADWDQHKTVCVSLKANAGSRPYILEDPPLARQSPTSVGYNNHSPKQPNSSQRDDVDSGSDVSSRPQGSYHPKESPVGQQQPAGDSNFQPRPNFPKQNGQRQATGDRRNQPKPAMGPSNNGQQPAVGPSNNERQPAVGPSNNGRRPAVGKKDVPRTDAGKQNGQQIAAVDGKAQLPQQTDDELEDKESQSSRQKGYQPLRRPSPPQTSAPKANRPTKPQKLRTMLPVTIGSSTKVKIAHISNPHNFYVHLDKEDDLAQIMRKVQLVEQNLALEEVAVGQIVAAKFSLDGVWYRARVEKVEKDKLCMTFIDYGNVDFVAMQDLRYLDPEIATLPVQAVWCRLVNVHPTSGQWSGDALSCFKIFTENIELLATLEKTRGGQAWITIKEESVGDTGELLMQTGLAAKSFPIHCSCLEEWQVGAEITLATPTQEKVGKVWAIHMTGIPADEVAVLFSELGKACRSMDDAVDPEQFAVGAVVAAQSPSDEVWYRGMILKADPNEYLVRYLDFGNCEVVANLRPLPAAFYKHLTLGVCFRLESPYANECVPDEFLLDDALTVKVLQVTGDTATVRVQFGEGSPFVQATASSVWNPSDGFDFPVAPLEESKPQEAMAVTPLHATHPVPQQDATATKLAKKPSSAQPTSSSVVGKGLALLPRLEIPSHPVGVVPVWVESLGRIAVQFLEVDKMTRLQQLTEELQDACQGGGPGTLTKPPAVGQLVCAQFSLDGMWNRCLVEEIRADSGIAIRFIDYGNAEVARLDVLQPLPNQFYDTCPMALAVAIEPVTTLTLESLREALTPTNAEALSLMMTVMDRTADPVRAVLTTEDGRSLEDFLAELVAVGRHEAEDVAAMDDLLTEATEKLAAVARQETAQALADAAESLVDYSEPAVTPPCVQLTVGQTLDLCIGAVHAPDLIMVIKGDTAEIAAYDKLAEDITEHCSKGAAAEYEPKEGDFCLAKSAAYDQWFRALVTSVEDGKCSMLFPDYGNSELVDMNDTRQMTEAFQNVPFQAVSCSILGVESREDGYSTEQCDAFKEFLTGLELITAEVVSKEPDDFYVIRVPSIVADLKKMGFLSD